MRGDLSTVDEVQNPRSPVSYNTRKVIRQKVAKKVAKVAILSGFLSTVDDVQNPRSPVSYNTRKGIRQKVAILSGFAQD